MSKFDHTVSASRAGASEFEPSQRHTCDTIKYQISVLTVNARWRRHQVREMRRRPTVYAEAGYFRSGVDVSCPVGSGAYINSHLPMSPCDF